MPRVLPSKPSSAPSGSRPPVVIVIPAPTPDGPIKGAYALANSLCESHEVTLVALKDGPGAQTALASRVHSVSLAHAKGGLFGKLLAYRRLLRQMRGSTPVVSVSMCFSADLINRLSRDRAFTIASVRGNLFENYRFDYGMPGTVLAWLHMRLLKGMGRIVAMSQSMRDQLLDYVPASRMSIIGNFIDESAVERHRLAAPPSSPSFRFVFLGSVSARKCPLLALQALHTLRQQGHDAALDIVGGGLLLAAARAEAGRLGLADYVVFHGSLDEPLPIVARAGALLLPSLSEGMPRAALEALHLGIPCVLRDVDGNRELIEDGVNGHLFAHDEALPATMARTMALARALPWPRPSLIPARFRQAFIAQQHAELVEALDGR